MLASVAALRSEDPYTRVGCCLLRHDHSVASLGYNGAPAGVEIDWSNRDERLRRVIHAEANALRYVKPGERGIIACTLMPCTDCVKLIASYRIPSIVFHKMYSRDEFGYKLAEEFGINLIKL